VVIGVLLKFMPQIPVFKRLVLTNEDPDESSPGAYAPSFGPEHPIKPGMKGTVVTPLRPAGRVQIGDRIIDAVADGDFVDAGEPVKVLTSNGFRTVVVRDVV
jgi:membrane-bound serine protease (ClpP class)